MSFMPTAPEPPTVLGRHRVLSPSASVRVSPLCLGTMNFGSASVGFTGSIDKDAAFKLMDEFFAAGGNFIDTANGYSENNSEIFIGEWMQARGVRNQIVLATKFSSPYTSVPGRPEKIHSNFTGNSSKSLYHSVNDSLKKLQTDFIDILYIHWWDWTMSIPELMLSLNALIQQGKVLYLGASDLPAYIVSKANQYARDHGLHGFVIYQGRWSVIDREFERDILHMVRDEGMALAPWGVIGSGQLKTAKQRKELEASGVQVRAEAMPGLAAKATAVAEAMQDVADQKADGSSISNLAIAYVMQKVPYVFPVLGIRTPEQLAGNIESLKIELSDEEIGKIEAGASFDPGWPIALFGASPDQNFLLNMSGKYDWIQRPQAIRPKKA